MRALLYSNTDQATYILGGPSELSPSVPNTQSMDIAFAPTVVGDTRDHQIAELEGYSPPMGYEEMTPECEVRVRAVCGHRAHGSQPAARERERGEEREKIERERERGEAEPDCFREAHLMAAYLSSPVCTAHPQRVDGALLRQLRQRRVDGEVRRQCRC